MRRRHSGSCETRATPRAPTPPRARGGPERPRRRNHIFAPGTAAVAARGPQGVVSALADPSVDWNGRRSQQRWARAPPEPTRRRLLGRGVRRPERVPHSSRAASPRRLRASRRSGRTRSAAAGVRRLLRGARRGALVEVARFFDARPGAGELGLRRRRAHLIEPPDAASESGARRRRAARPGLDARDLAGVARALASAGRADRAYEAPAARARGCRGVDRAAANRLWAFAVQTSGCAALPLAQDLEKAVVELAPSLRCGTRRRTAGRQHRCRPRRAFGRLRRVAGFENFAAARAGPWRTSRAPSSLHGDDSGGLADNGLDVRRILDAVAALAVPLAEGRARARPGRARRPSPRPPAAPAPRLMARCRAARDAAADFQAKDLWPRPAPLRAAARRRPPSPRPSRSAPTRRAAPRPSHRGSAHLAARSPPSARRFAVLRLDAAPRDRPCRRLHVVRGQHDAVRSSASCRARSLFPGDTAWSSQFAHQMSRSAYTTASLTPCLPRRRVGWARRVRRRYGARTWRRLFLSPTAG